MARPYSPAYGASKAALESLTLTFAAAFAEDGICSIAICPGDIREGMLGKALPDLAEAQGRSVDELVNERTFQSPNEFSEIVVDCLNSHGMTLNGALVGPDRAIEPLARVVVTHA
jgi:NAD(P)-dependent dehydrogenase (short-subunit alcohol dehydrogenase family)